MKKMKENVMKNLIYFITKEPKSMLISKTTKRSSEAE